MNIYNLPHDKQFNIDFLNDINNATEIIIVSPYLSFEVIKIIREKAKHLPRHRFTIVYDVEHNLVLNIDDIKQIEDDELISSITWRLYKNLHSKIYFFKRKDDYSFYHGSANFTNRGLGVGNLTKGIRNVEIMSRLDYLDITQNEIDLILTPYLENEIVEPIFDEDKGCLIVPEEDLRKRKEYKFILSRMGLNISYFSASAKGSILDFAGFFQGYYKSKNHYSLKVHTTSITQTKNEKAEFTLFYKELKWFLGDFRKGNCNTKTKRLILVWKVDEDYKGKLVVFTIYPYQLFKLLSNNNNRRKLLDINFNSSRTIWFKKSFETGEINWRNNKLTLPSNQIKILNSYL